MGAALGFAQAQLIHVQADAIGQEPLSNVRLVLDSDSHATASGESSFATLCLENGAKVRVLVDLGESDPLLHGATIIASGSLKPAAFPEDEYLWQNGAIARLRTSAFELSGEVDQASAVLHEARLSAINAIGDADDAHALLQALVCGWRHSISQSQIYTGFQICGLAHLVAVSGAHLNIVTAVFASALRAMHVGRRISSSMLAAVLVAYLVFSGMPISCIRAALMTSIGLFSIYGRRRPSAQNALGICIMAIVITNPCASVSVSFALSALSTAGIVLFSPLLSSWFAALTKVHLGFAAEALSLTFSAGVLAQPYACSIFNALPLASPFANAICAPLFPLTCAFGMLATMACFVPLPGSSALLGVAACLAHLLEAVVGIVSDAPCASVPVSISPLTALFISLLSAGLLYLCWTSLRIQHAVTCSVLCMALFAGTAYASGFEDAIVMLDIGQGDSFLVKSRGRALLVDTGNQDKRLLEQLARCSIAKLDAALLTHSDDDHVGSLDALEKCVHVDRIFVADGIQDSPLGKNTALMARASQTAEEVIGLKVGDCFDIGAFRITVIWPLSLSCDGGNADSVCLRIEYDGDDDGIVDFTTLLTGDAEHEELAQMVAHDLVGDIDVLKVGHHGSHDGLDSKLLETLEPEVALISVGAGNRYGHPAQDTLDLLAEAGCKVYRTDIQGQVKCSFSPGKIRVTLQ